MTQENLSLKQENPRILVTGGAGYIGSHTCKLLKREGFEPICYDNLSRGHRELVKWGPLVEGDLFELDKLTQCLVDYDIQAVIHFAAFAYIKESVENPQLYFRNNLYGSLLLFEAMRRANVRNIVFSSTCAVYGDSIQEEISESTPPNPITPYGLSKKMVEEILLKYEKNFDFNPCILRYFNAAGADPEGETGECHEPEPHILPTLLRKAIKEETFVINGDQFDTPDGTCIRDFIHVTDLSEAHILALKKLIHSRTDHKVYNLGSGKGYSLLELTKAVGRALGKNIDWKIGPARPGDAPWAVASSERFLNEFGWQPKNSTLDSMITTALKWMNKN
jgi:UDP-arabinose 4-epimerase